jgi:hypothetical protein
MCGPLAAKFDFWRKDHILRCSSHSLASNAPVRPRPRALTRKTLNNGMPAEEFGHVDQNSMRSARL